MTVLSVSWFPPINPYASVKERNPVTPSSSPFRDITKLIPFSQPALTQPKMQFTLITSVLIACMTAFVSASPIPAPQQVEVVGLMARETELELARSPEAEAEPGCSRYTCL